MTAMLERAAAPLRPGRDWGWDAICVGADPSLFFGSKEVPLAGSTTIPGRTLCGSCPVQRDCLIDALLEKDFRGLRAGYLGHERRHTLRRTGSIEAALADFDAGVFYQPRSS